VKKFEYTRRERKKEGVFAQKWREVRPHGRFSRTTMLVFPRACLF
jgi:hypothetical protein